LAPFLGLTSHKGDESNKREERARILHVNRYGGEKGKAKRAKRQAAER